eukprot:Skav234970  [mRNA]  locus=scaffold122:6100:8078:+ [translate_table: standard]
MATPGSSGLPLCGPPSPADLHICAWEWQAHLSSIGRPAIKQSGCSIGNWNGSKLFLHVWSKVKSCLHLPTTCQPGLREDGSCTGPTLCVLCWQGHQAVG